MAQRRLRQADIAKLAGVSQATVSLVINNRSDDLQISEDTRQRVLDAVRRLGYVVNPVARSLAGGRNHLIGVYTFEPVFPIQHWDFYHPFLLGIEEECEARSQDLVLFTSTGGTERPRSIYRDGSNRLKLADGCVLLGRDIDRAELSRMTEEGFPFVFIGQRDVPGPGLSYVTADYAAGVAGIVERMAGLGHRRIALVAGGEVSEAGREQERGYREAVRRLSSSGIEPNVFRVSMEDVDDGWVRDLLRRQFTGMFVGEALTAERIAEVAGQLGIGVPADWSIATLVDLPHGTDLDWSGLHIPGRDIGRAAISLLLNMMDADEYRPSHRLLPCPLVEGSTVGPPPSA